MGNGLVLLGEFEWFEWSRFRRITIRFADGRPDGIRETRYRDAYAVAFGIERLLQGGTTLRGGIHFDTTPTVDGFRDTTVPDSDRLWLGLGASFRFPDKSYLDFAFNHVFFRKTKVDLDRPIAGVGVAHINGSVDSVVNTISVGFRSSF